MTRTPLVHQITPSFLEIFATWLAMVLKEECSVDLHEEREVF